MLFSIDNKQVILYFWPKKNTIKHSSIFFHKNLKTTFLNKNNRIIFNSFLKKSKIFTFYPNVLFYKNLFFINLKFKIHLLNFIANFYNKQVFFGKKSYYLI